MGFSQAQDASPDVRAFLDKVLDSPHGAKLVFGNAGNKEKTCPHCGANNVNRNTAWNFRQRCFNIKTKERKLSKDIYSPGDAMYGKSPWDSVSIYLHDEPDGRCSVVGVVNLAGMTHVAELVELEEKP